MSEMAVLLQQGKFKSLLETTVKEHTHITLAGNSEDKTIHGG